MVAEIVRLANSSGCIFLEFSLFFVKSEAGRISVERCKCNSKQLIADKLQARNTNTQYKYKYKIHNTQYQFFNTNTNTTTQYTIQIQLKNVEYYIYLLWTGLRQSAMFFGLRAMWKQRKGRE